MKAPRWWRRWFGGNTVNPTGPASPPPAGVERDLSAFYRQFPTDMEPVPLRPRIEPLPGSLPFEPSLYIPTDQLRIVKANTPETEPEMLEGQTLEQAAHKRDVRHARAIRTFHLEFARLVREEADGNYSRMARRLGVAPSVVGRWASGKLSPSIQNFLKFCIEYEYVLGDFTGDDEFL